MKSAIATLNSKIKDLGQPESRLGTDAEIERGKQAGIPDALIFFYTLCSPEFAFIINGNDQIWSIDDTIGEIEDEEPGLSIFRLGYCAFGSTNSQHLFCYSTRDGEIYLFDGHADYEEVTPDSDLTLYSLRIASNLEDFLIQFCSGVLIMDFP